MQVNDIKHLIEVLASNKYHKNVNNTLKYIYIYIYIYICLFVYVFGQHMGPLIFNVALWDFYLWHVGSSSLTRD